MSLGHFDVLPATHVHAHLDDCVALRWVSHVITSVNLCHDIPIDSLSFLLFSFSLSFHLVMISHLIVPSYF